MSMGVEAGAVAEVERWFLARGLPHFINDYSASRDVLTRALPVLTLILLFELFGALKLSWPLWANLVIVGGGLAALLAVWAVVNRLRHRPLLARPERVGTQEVAVFVLVPSLLPLLAGGQWRTAINTFLGNLVLLGLIYLVLSYGLVPMTRWAVGRLVAQLEVLLGLLVRALPLLLLFVALGVVFVVSRIPQEVGNLARFESCDEIRALVAGTPAERLAMSLPDDCVTAAVEMSRRQWGNVGLVVLFSQALQVIFVSVMIGVFLVAFGLLAVTPEIAADWSGSPADVLLEGTLWGRSVALTAQLVTVATLLAVVSGFSFTLSLLTDDAYRREFLEDVVGEVREAFAVRAAYLNAVSHG